MQIGGHGAAGRNFYFEKAALWAGSGVDHLLIGTGDIVTLRALAESMDGQPTRSNSN
jgi:hypothetical protein